MFNKTVKFKSLEGELDVLIRSRVKFVVVGLNSGNFGMAMSLIEKRIDEQGLKCRVITKGRDNALMNAVEFVPVVSLVGAAFVAGHRLLTKNPDFIVEKDKGLFSQKIYVNPVKNS